MTCVRYETGKEITGGEEEILREGDRDRQSIGIRENEYKEHKTEGQ